MSVSGPQKIADCRIRSLSPAPRTEEQNQRDYCTLEHEDKIAVIEEYDGVYYTHTHRAATSNFFSGSEMSNISEAKKITIFCDSLRVEF